MLHSGGGGEDGVARYQTTDSGGGGGGGGGHSRHHTLLASNPHADPEFDVRVLCLSDLSADSDSDARLVVMCCTD